MSVVSVAIVAVLIRSLLEGLQFAMQPIKVPELAVKGLALAFSGAAVFVYNLNLLAAVGLNSGSPVFDLTVSVVALWYAVLTGHDLLDAVKNYGKSDAAPKG